MRLPPFATLVACASLSWTNPLDAQITIDGARDANYGGPLAVQLAPTGFGDNTDADPLAANGSELNAAYAVIRDGYLHLLLTGNLETNFNKLDIFIDSLAGAGQNELGSTNPNVDFDGLNAMAGLTFDADFAADFYLTASGGNSPDEEFFFNFAEVKDGGTGSYLGQTPAGEQTVTLTSGIEVGIDNSNTVGVTASDASGAASVSTGIEFKIPLSEIGDPSGPVKICAFINNTGHTSLSNQVLGSLPAGTPNPGVPGSVDFESEAGSQFFTVPADLTIITPESVSSSTSGSDLYPASPNLLNANGLSDAVTPANFPAVTHADSSPSNAWVTAAFNSTEDDYFASDAGTSGDSGPNPALTFTLATPTLVDGFLYWGYSVLGNEAKTFNLTFKDASGTQIGSAVSLESASPVGSGSRLFRFSPVGGVKTIEVSITANYPVLIGGDRVGLGEVRFTSLATWKVTNSGDSGIGSLRQTIADAPAGATIIFDSALSGQTITLVNGQLTIDKDLTIDASDLLLGITIDANGSVTNHRVMQIHSGNTVTLTNLTLSNGEASGSFPNSRGGGIFNDGTLTLNSSTVSGNSAESSGGGISNQSILTLNLSTVAGNAAVFGGGIRNDGALTLNQSTLVGNSANSGGGIYNDGALTLNQSTLAGNTAEFGGGILNEGTLLTLNQSTLAGNSAEYGGGIQNFSPLTLNQSTLAANSADEDGGGIHNNSALTLHNSVVAANSASFGLDIVEDFGGSYGTNTGVNFIGDTADADFPGTEGTDYLTGDPMLAPLGDYGGPTPTMPPLPGSPVIDAAGTSDPGGTDQRGAPRFANSALDIGAIEYQGTDDLALFWETDWDGDGNTFGVEKALDTDAFLPDPDARGNLSVPVFSGGTTTISFGRNDDARPYTIWIVERSPDLTEGSWDEVYRYDGRQNLSSPAANFTDNLVGEKSSSFTYIELSDLSPLPGRAFYRFKAEISEP